MIDKICDEKDVVMVVDDDEAIEQVIGELIGHYGCVHASFTDPAKALNYYKENVQRITILLTDLNMPSISGSGLIRGVSDINPNLPIILLTGDDKEHVPDDIVPLVRHILRKPFNQRELLDTLRMELNKIGSRT
jgi:FixJ family two-component response regulator